MRTGLDGTAASGAREEPESRGRTCARREVASHRTAEEKMIAGVHAAGSRGGDIGAKLGSSTESEERLSLPACRVGGSGLPSHVGAPGSDEQGAGTVQHSHAGGNGLAGEDDANPGEELFGCDTEDESDAEWDQGLDFETAEAMESRPDMDAVADDGACGAAGARPRSALMSEEESDRVAAMRREYVDELCSALQGQKLDGENEEFPAIGSLDVDAIVVKTRELSGLLRPWLERGEDASCSLRDINAATGKRVRLIKLRDIPNLLEVAHIGNFTLYAMFKDDENGQMPTAKILAFIRNAIGKNLESLDTGKSTHDACAPDGVRVVRALDDIFIQHEENAGLVCWVLAKMGIKEQFTDIAGAIRAIRGTGMDLSHAMALYVDIGVLTQKTVALASADAHGCTRDLRVFVPGNMRTGVHIVYTDELGRKVKRYNTFWVHQASFTAVQLSRGGGIFSAMHQDVLGSLAALVGVCRRRERRWKVSASAIGEHGEAEVPDRSQELDEAGEDANADGAAQIEDAPHRGDGALFSRMEGCVDVLEAHARALERWNDTEEFPLRTEVGGQINIDALEESLGALVEAARSVAKLGITVQTTPKMFAGQAAKAIRTCAALARTAAAMSRASIGCCLWLARLADEWVQYVYSGSLYASGHAQSWKLSLLLHCANAEDEPLVRAKRYGRGGGTQIALGPLLASTVAVCVGDSAADREAGAVPRVAVASLTGAPAAQLAAASASLLACTTVRDGATMVVRAAKITRGESAVLTETKVARQWRLRRLVEMEMWYHTGERTDSDVVRRLVREATLDVFSVTELGRAKLHYVITSMLRQDPDSLTADDDPGVALWEHVRNERKSSCKRWAELSNLVDQHGLLLTREPKDARGRLLVDLVVETAYVDSFLRGVGRRNAGARECGVAWLAHELLRLDEQVWLAMLAEIKWVPFYMSEDKGERDQENDRVYRVVCGKILDISRPQEVAQFVNRMQPEVFERLMSSLPEAALFYAACQGYGAPEFACQAAESALVRLLQRWHAGARQCQDESLREAVEASPISLELFTLDQRRCAVLALLELVDHQERHPPAEYGEYLQRAASRPSAGERAPSSGQANAEDDRSAQGLRGRKQYLLLSEASHQERQGAYVLYLSFLTLGRDPSKRLYIANKGLQHAAYESPLAFFAGSALRYHTQNKLHLGFLEQAMVPYPNKNGKTAVVVGKSVISFTRELLAARALMRARARNASRKECFVYRRMMTPSTADLVEAEFARHRTDPHEPGRDKASTRQPVERDDMMEELLRHLCIQYMKETRKRNLLELGKQLGIRVHGRGNVDQPVPRPNNLPEGGVSAEALALVYRDQAQASDTVLFREAGVADGVDRENAPCEALRSSNCRTLALASGGADGLASSAEGARLKCESGLGSRFVGTCSCKGGGQDFDNNYGAYDTPGMEVDTRQDDAAEAKESIVSDDGRLGRGHPCRSNDASYRARSSAAPRAAVADDGKDAFCNEDSTRASMILDQSCATQRDGTALRLNSHDAGEGDAESVLALGSTVARIARQDCCAECAPSSAFYATDCPPPNNYAKEPHFCAVDATQGESQAALQHHAAIGFSEGAGEPESKGVCKPLPLRAHSSREADFHAAPRAATHVHCAMERARDASGYQSADGGNNEGETSRRQVSSGWAGAGNCCIAQGALEMARDASGYQSADGGNDENETSRRQVGSGCVGAGNCCSVQEAVKSAHSTAGHQSADGGHVEGETAARQVGSGCAGIFNGRRAQDAADAPLDANGYRSSGVEPGKGSKARKQCRSGCSELEGVEAAGVPPVSKERAADLAGFERQAVDSCGPVDGSHPSDGSKHISGRSEVFMDDVTLRRSFCERLGSVLLEMLPSDLRQAVMHALQGAARNADAEVQNTKQRMDDRASTPDLASLMASAAQSRVEVRADQPLSHRDRYGEQDVSMPSVLFENRSPRRHTESVCFGSSAVAPGTHFLPSDGCTPVASGVDHRAQRVDGAPESRNDNHHALVRPRNTCAEGAHGDQRDSVEEFMGAPHSTCPNGEADFLQRSEVSQRLCQSPNLGQRDEKKSRLLGREKQQCRTSAGNLAHAVSPPCSTGDGAVVGKSPPPDPQFHSVARSNYRPFLSQAQHEFGAQNVSESYPTCNGRSGSLERGSADNSPYQHIPMDRGHSEMLGVSQPDFRSVDPEFLSSRRHQVKERVHERHVHETKNGEWEDMVADFARLKNKEIARKRQKREKRQRQRDKRRRLRQGLPIGVEQRSLVPQNPHETLPQGNAAHCHDEWQGTGLHDWGSGIRMQEPLVYAGPSASRPVAPRLARPLHEARWLQAQRQDAPPGGVYDSYGALRTNESEFAAYHRAVMGAPIRTARGRRTVAATALDVRQLDSERPASVRHRSADEESNVPHRHQQRHAGAQHIEDTGKIAGNRRSGLPVAQSQDAGRLAGACQGAAASAGGLPRRTAGKDGSRQANAAAFAQPSALAEQHRYCMQSSSVPFEHGVASDSRWCEEWGPPGRGRTERRGRDRAVPAPVAAGHATPRQQFPRSLSRQRSQATTPMMGTYQEQIVSMNYTHFVNEDGQYVCAERSNVRYEQC